MPAAWEFEQAVNNVTNYYNTDAQGVWSVINQYQLSPDQVQGLLPTADDYTGSSGYTVNRYANGAIAGWSNTTTMPATTADPIQQSLNSNAGTTALQTYKLPANTDYSGTGGAFNANKGISGGVSGAVHVMAEVSAGITAAGLGIKLGKWVDSALYNVNPDFWDNHGMASLNPETWDSLTIDMSDKGWEGASKRAFNAIFGLNPDGSTQMYIDENAAAYLAQYMQEKGVFSTAESVRVNDLPSESYPYADVISQRMPLTVSYTGVYGIAANGSQIALDLTPGYTYLIFNPANTRQIEYVWGRTDRTSATPYSYTYDNKTVYYGIGNGYISQVPVSFSNGSNNGGKVNDPPAGPMIWLALYNSVTSSGGVDGIGTQTGATTPNFNGCTTPADYLQALQNQYPDMFNNAVTQSVAQPDGTVVIHKYVPVGTPSATTTQDEKPTTNPETTGQSQSDTSVDSESAPQTLLETIVKYITNVSKPDTPTTQNPPDTGDGNTPPVVVPTGNASALWSVYNPTQAQLNSFGAWLWSSNFIDQILKLFNNPMQSIIGVHKIFATPPVSGSGNIVVGYLDSGVGSNLVSAQYTTVNCGTVNVREQFGNVFDYTDTQIRLYLPFIGIVDLDVSDVMRGAVSVVYHVDVITGACLAEVKIIRDGAGGTLYQYAGDAAVRYPISSGSYMGVVAGIASAVGGVASAIASGGATLPLAAGAVAGGIGGAHTTVQHSGNFSGNAGAMGAKKPYIIIERPQTLIANGFENYQGSGNNTIRSVSQMSGYFKMSDVKTDSISGASESEIEAIKSALETGVYT